MVVLQCAAAFGRSLPAGWREEEGAQRREEGAPVARAGIL